MAWEAEVKRSTEEDLKFTSEHRPEIGEGQRFLAIKMTEGEVWILRDDIEEVRVKNANPVLPGQTGL